jgi:hypothetical protein
MQNDFEPVKVRNMQSEGVGPIWLVVDHKTTSSLFAILILDSLVPELADR